MNGLKLGTIGKDSATGLDGMVTHMGLEIGGAVFYRFQPHGLNPKTGKPVDSFWATPARLIGFKTETITDFPEKILGTKARDRASGFEGTVVSVTRHVSGCYHASLQPSGILAETGTAVEREDFDVRRLEGPAIPKLSEDERNADQRKRPSPISVTSHLPKF